MIAETRGWVLEGRVETDFISPDHNISGRSLVQLLSPSAYRVMRLGLSLSWAISSFGDVWLEVTHRGE